MKMGDIDAADLDRVTLEDVARLSAVSTATVSRAIHGDSRVRPDTRDRVLRAAAKLGYRPNSVARELATGSSDTVGLLVPSSGDLFWGEVATGIEEHAAEHGLSILLANSHGDAKRERQMLDVFLARRVRGVVVGSAAAPEAWFDRIPAPVPIVLVGWDPRQKPEDLELAQRLPPEEGIRLFDQVEVPGGWYAHLAPDEISGGRLAVRELLRLGHTHIALITGPPVRPALLRLLGFRAELAAEGLNPDLIIACDDTLEGGQHAALELLNRDPRPTGIVAYNDLVATGALRAAHMLGLQTPRAVSVIGFDDIEIARFVEPPLTTIRQPKREMGKLAMELLSQALRGEPGRIERVLPVTLVSRASTAPPPRRGRKT
jgi:LacI family transcriptional regulator